MVTVKITSKFAEVPLWVPEQDPAVDGQAGGPGQPAHHPQGKSNQSLDKIKTKGQINPLTYWRFSGPYFKVLWEK